MKTLLKRGVLLFCLALVTVSCRSRFAAQEDIVTAESQSHAYGFDVNYNIVQRSTSTNHLNKIKINFDPIFNFTEDFCTDHIWYYNFSIYFENPLVDKPVFTIESLNEPTIPKIELREDLSILAHKCRKRIYTISLPIDAVWRQWGRKTLEVTIDNDGKDLGLIQVAGVVVRQIIKGGEIPLDPKH